MRQDEKASDRNGSRTASIPAETIQTLHAILTASFSSLMQQKTDSLCLDKRGMNSKVIELKLQCFYTCITTSYISNGKIICFINSWGRRELNIVKQRCIADGGQCLKGHL